MATVCIGPCCSLLLHSYRKPHKDNCGKQYLLWHSPEHATTQNSIIEGYVLMKTKLRFFASGIKKNIVYLDMLPEAKQNPGKHEFKLSLVQISKSND